MLLFNEIAETISLDGDWKFSLSGGDGPDVIQVPGSWEAQGYSKYPEGPAIYRRKVSIPGDWARKTIQLELDAVSYHCAVSINGAFAGEHRGLWMPFALDVSHLARPGQENELELAVTKPGERYPMRGSLAGFLPDVATTFGGIWQPARLRALRVGLASPLVETSFADKSIHVQCRAETFGKHLNRPEWAVQAWQGERFVAEMLQPFREDGQMDAWLRPDEIVHWSPERPALYTVRVTLLEAGEPAAVFTRRTGFRRLSVEGDQLLFNGKPFQVRGILSWGWEPDRIAPYYTPDQARTEMRKARGMGFNLIKLCLFVPNPDYFDIADEEGMLLWEELPMWLPEVTDTLREQAPQEYAEIAGGLARHPSLALWSLGCELSQSVDAGFLERLNLAVRPRTQDALLCDNSGSGESYGGLDFDFSDFTDYHPYYDLHYFEPLLDNWRRDWQPPRPWIFGEFCDSDTFRDLNEIIQASGGHRPWWLTSENPVTTWRGEAQAMLAWEERLAQAQAGFPLDEVVRISHQQSYTIRKFTLEALRRRRGIGGYIITGLRDTPISTSGVWDDLGRAKWAEEEYRQINADAVLALDVGRRRTWRFGGDRPDRLDPYNLYGGEAATWHVIMQDSGPGFAAGGQLAWALFDPQGGQARAGEHNLEHAVPAGAPLRLGTIHCALPLAQQAGEWRLEVRFEDSVRQVSNRWPVWIYPRPELLPAGTVILDPEGLLDETGDWLKPVPRLVPGAPLDGVTVLITNTLDENIWRAIETGAHVLLLQQGGGPLPVQRCPFWREGIKLFAPHPLWEEFPQHGYSDMQFFALASDLAFDTHRLKEVLPAAAQIAPVMRRLDAREFTITDYLLNIRLGRGRLLACALRLQGGAGSQPFGWRRSPAGAAMLVALVHVLF